MTTLSSSDLLSAPAYAQMVDDILGNIADGRLQVGQRLASETMLKEQYGISVNSIKRGLGLLVDRGVLRRRRGSGTFVAGNGTPPPQQLVRRDTIAILRGWEYWRYHPFFSEQRSGILAGLSRHGWKVYDLQHDVSGTAPADREVSYRHMSADMVKFELEQHPEIAGVICVQGAEQAAQALAASDRVVVHTGATKLTPYVTYDWPAEIERLFRIALTKGARNLGVVSSIAEKELTGMCRRSVRAAGLAQREVSLTCLHCEPSQNGTPLINRAYEVTSKAFSKRPGFDGLIITSDFEARGVTDALAALPPARWSDLIVVALLNKESKLHARIPMTALISDGYACGIAMADLLHEQISSGGNCTSGVTMSCHQVEWR